jgi:hypothetical protein
MTTDNNGKESDRTMIQQNGEQEKDEIQDNLDIRPSSTVTKPVIYVPPRLDQEYYQAEVPDSISDAPSADDIRG